MKSVAGSNIAMMVNLDDCLGCFGCEAACRETHRYPYDEDWMRVVRREPYLVDGKLRQYHLVAPELDKCAACYERNANPLCVSGCPAGALAIGALSDLAQEAQGKHVAIFAA